MTTADAIAAIRAAQDKAFPIDLGLNKLLEALEGGEIVSVDDLLADLFPMQIEAALEGEA